MNDVSLGALLTALVILLALSGFFSASETAMMALNRYRLRHLAKQGNKGARRASSLLRRPDRLIGVILIGNNLVNILAASLATLIAIRLLGEQGIFADTVVLTVVILIFSEVTPKIIAALRPEAIAFPASRMLLPLLKLLYPAVWLINQCSNALSRLVGVDPASPSNHDLAAEELRTLIREAGAQIPAQHQQMLLNVFDLESATVEDIMIPRAQVVGLNLDDDVPTLLKTIRNSDYTRLPIFKGDINNIVGVIHLRNAARFLYGEDAAVTHDAIRRFSQEPYFVPQGTPLHVQLLNFQEQKQRMAFVVDEYGEVQGLVTLEDLLEEIVGDFTTNLAEEACNDIQAAEDGWYLIDGSASLREINRRLNWDLPMKDAKTLNGLIMDHLQGIPDGHACFKLGKYQFMTTKLSEKRCDQAQVRLIQRSLQQQLFSAQ